VLNQNRPFNQHTICGYAFLLFLPSPLFSFLFPSPFSFSFPPFLPSLFSFLPLFFPPLFSFLLFFFLLFSFPSFPFTPPFLSFLPGSFPFPPFF
ncbi:hypothetical protein ACXWR7_10355, partial [Streptococcus pyogenes]